MAGNRPFYPHACAVCNKIGTDLKICENCIMISYCGNEHQAEHWPEHEKICKALQQTRRSLNRKPMEIYEGYPAPCMTWKGWLELQNTFMLTLMQKLHRHLTTYEREMCLYSIKCHFICDNDDGFVNCPNCASVCCCAEHLPYLDEHSEACTVLKRCFDLDVTDNGSNDEHVELGYLENINSRKAFRNMKSFAKRYIKPIITEGSIPNMAIIHSEYFTYPLTILYGLEQMKKLGTQKMHSHDDDDNYPECRMDKHTTIAMYSMTSDFLYKDDKPEILDITSLVIHVIGADNTNIVGWQTWEVLFHLIESLKDLSIIMIGPELGKEMGYSTIEQQTCNMCRNKNLSFECHDVFYEDYVQSPLYKKPDLTVAFNARFYEYTCGFLQHTDIWMRTIQAIANQNCPFILTSLSRYASGRNLNELHYELKTLMPKLDLENPYASLKPHRVPSNNKKFGYSNSIISIYTVFPKKVREN